MLVLFETPAGYAVFKVLNEKVLKETSDLYTEFHDAESASSIVKLKEFSKFEDTTDALSAATALIEGRLSKKLRKMLRKLFVKDLAEETLAVPDAKLGGIIKEKLNIPCVHSSAILELIRGIRSQMEALIPGIEKKEFAAFSLGLAHSLSRYKLKFSPDKIDTMIVQAISLLDDLDKETNNYVMRCKEMYGWHFPELAKLIQDNMAYVRLVHKLGPRDNALTMDMTDCIPEELCQDVRDATVISLGTEITDKDIETVRSVCEQILEINDYRAQLYEYIKNRMLAVAPNLTALVGELVGARLISHAGTLLSLAKHPSSTVQILGAEKALFRALKTRSQTPKYGLLYHASLVGQANTKVKGKMSRMLAAKASLAIRVDALGESVDAEMGIEHRATLEKRLKELEEGQDRRISGTGKFRAKEAKFAPQFDEAGAAPDRRSDVAMKAKKRQSTDTNGNGHSAAAEDDAAATSPKKKKIKVEAAEEVDEEAATPKKKKKKSKGEPAIKEEVEEEMEVVESATKKKKKKKRSSAAAAEDSD